jgi:hypothetical protein
MAIQIRPAVIPQTPRGLPLPQMDIHWTEQELANFARLLSRRAAAPSDTLPRATKEGA